MVKLLSLAVFITLIICVSCNQNNQTITAKHVVGKWSQYDGTTTKNGNTTHDFYPSNAIRYDFKENGILNAGLDSEDDLDWKLTEDDELLIESDGIVAIYKSHIESDSIMILSREFDGSTFHYYFRKGW